MGLVETTPLFCFCCFRHLSTSSGVRAKIGHSQTSGPEQKICSLPSLIHSAGLRVSTSAFADENRSFPWCVPTATLLSVFRGQGLFLPFVLLKSPVAVGLHTSRWLRNLVRFHRKAPSQPLLLCELLPFHGPCFQIFFKMSKERVAIALLGSLLYAFIC